jgi:hypothetical protein
VCAYDPANHWVYSNWKGSLTVDSVQHGADALLEQVQRHQCAYLLNDNRRVLGTWNPAIDWTLKDWTPRAVALGLTHFAHIVQPDSMATLTAEALTWGISKRLCIALFEDIEPAKQWLRQAQAASRDADVAPGEHNRPN